MNNIELEKKIKNIIAELSDKKGFVSSVEVLMKLDYLSKSDYEQWRHGRVAYLEKVCKTNLSKLKTVEIELNSFNELLKFPKIKKDCAFVLDSNIDYNSVAKIIESSSSNLLKNVKLFDIFESESLGLDKKSLAFELTYFDEKKTLTEDEVEKEFWNAIESVKTKLNAELRG